MILRARHVVPVTAAPIEDGAVVIENGAIRAVGPWEEIQGSHQDETVDLGEQILLPGLINAHCHLDYSLMRDAISPQRSFTQWIRRINAIKRSAYPQDYEVAIQHGYDELVKWGTTTVANIETFPEMLAAFSDPPVRTWWFLEMIDIRQPFAAKQVLQKAVSYFEAAGGREGGLGLSPHSPYTASGDLIALGGKLADERDILMSAHVAESKEEWNMFRKGRGALFEFMAQLGRWMGDCYENRTPLMHFAACTALSKRWLLVHMNELGDDDFALLEQLPKDNRPSIAHCPGSHAYFRHSAFPLWRLRDMGINLCLGTDSLASTSSLSMFDEMRAVAKGHPDLPALEILKMATVNGAAALGMSGRLGAIAPGCLADLIALPSPAQIDDVHRAILKHRKPIQWRMLGGKIDETVVGQKRARKAATF